MLVKCFCTNCAGHLEFEEQNAGEEIPCPHCGFRTTLFLPGTQAPDSEIVNLILRGIQRRRRLAAAGQVVVALVVGLAIWYWALPFVQQCLGQDVSRWVALLVLVLGGLLASPVLICFWFWVAFPFLVVFELVEIRRRLELIAPPSSGTVKSEQHGDDAE
jgi:hypothetical protein